ncbi:hypothetical protein N658DRAFT_479203 [Parathielavia hyrcaniae]|uniref:Zn(2)-C6 fungal-type domain-containing protein n=1 Tax=Parathielavia hyrcaniae TaxID=113614 RepID=A0AAN6PT47_9PEZI|nr:hypothetical protein N658DRAFT_479203 [Parathielavia hyrcaniae]
MEALLTCSGCSRSLPSVPALERHRLRCRFRARSRKKSCAECARSKVRCDQGVPICSRCAVHALPCAYPRTETGPLGVGANPAQPAAMPSGTSSGVALPLTPSSDLSRPQWASESTIKPQADVPNQQDLFSVAGWVPDGSIDFLNEIYCSRSRPLASPPYVPTGQSNPPPLANASHILPVSLGDAWTSVGHGLDYIDHVLKGYVDGFATGLQLPSFIHFRNWDGACRPLALVEAAAVAQLYRTRTPASDPVLIRSIDAQLLQIQRNIARHTRAEDVTTIQATLLYAGMRLYRAGSTACETLDRVSLRLMQHVLSKSLHCITPHINPSPDDWESWIQDESIRRCFIILTSLDYAAHARQALPTALCAVFPDAPLPCPSRVWEPPSAEEWAVRYRSWEEEYCGGRGPLRGRDLLCWVQGRETGREEQLRAWLQGVEPELGGLVWECARAQGRTAGVGELL